MPVGSHGSGALAVACLVADPSWFLDAGITPCERCSSRPALGPTRALALMKCDGPAGARAMVAKPKTTIDAHKIAVLLRGRMLPQAYIYPAVMRATRDLLRRRMHLMRKRAELRTHINWSLRFPARLVQVSHPLLSPRLNAGGSGRPHWTIFRRSADVRCGPSALRSWGLIR